MRGRAPQGRNMVVLDANAVLRYLLKDINEQYEEVERVIGRGDACVYMPVVAEAVYVLSGVYGFSREKIDEALESLIDEVAVYEEDILRTALRLYSMTSLDFVDCWLVARNTVAGEEIITFDKALRKHLR